MTGMRRLPRLIVLLALAAAPLISTPPAAAQVLLDRIVAVVDDDVITATELEAEARFVAGRLVAENRPQPPQDVLLRQVLERMILDRLTQRAAARAGIEVDDFTLNQAVREIAQRNGLTLDQLRRRLETDGTAFARFREEIRGEIRTARLQQRSLAGQVQVSDQEVEALVAGQAEAGNQEYRLAHILIGVPEGAAPEVVARARARADEVKRKSYREGLTNHRDKAELSRELVTIHTDLPVEFRPEELKLQAPDAEALKEIYRELEFFKLLCFSILSTFVQLKKLRLFNLLQIKDPFNRTHGKLHLLSNLRNLQISFS